MSEVIVLNDSSELISTSQFPGYASFPFQSFNPVQSRVLEVFADDANCIIAAATSAGKTVCAEMYVANEVRIKKGKAIYLAPLKALAKEKVDDWTSPKHHFHGLNISICTGDYQLTIDRKQELEKADIILLTSEMLNSRVRNFTSEQNDFLKLCNTVIVDESHLLTVAGRGDRLEVGLMKFCQINPNARLVFLSATMPNVKEIAEWIGSATNRKTYLINSVYRPCPLEVHYHAYEATRVYDANETEKVNSALRLVKKYPEDKFLIFAHTKRTGQLMKNTLSRNNVECEFHNADLEKEKRHELERKFRDKELRVIIATSTLAWGLNLPARRVIILGVHRGLDVVEPHDIIQMAGRAGRVGLDPRGDVHVLLPDKDFVAFKKYVSKSGNIESRLLDYVGGGHVRHYKTLAFHLVSEIHHGHVETKDDIHEWYQKSLAYFQAKDLDDEIVDSTLDLLLKCGAIYKDGDSYKVTGIGKVASMFYYSPFDVADLKRNFDDLFGKGGEKNDILASMAFGNVDTIRMGIVSRAERDAMSSYSETVKRLKPGTMDTAIKGGFSYWCLLNGKDPGPLVGFMRNLQFDFPRLNSVVQYLDSIVGKWGKRQWCERLSLRMSYGVSDDLVEFCMIPNIGKVRANRLWSAGVRSLEDVIDNENNCVGRALNLKPESVAKIQLEAKKKLLSSY